MKRFFALGAFIALSACGGPDKSARALVDVVRPTEQSNYGVFLWREPNGDQPTSVYFGLAAIGADHEPFQAMLKDIQPFGRADFSASVVSYAWSDLKDFTVCAASYKDRQILNDSVYAAVIEQVKFTSAAECSGPAFVSYPPPVGVKAPGIR